MCGIAGILQSNPGLYSQEHLKKMTDAIAHRGPDGEALWQNSSNNVIFGHRRLSILDLSSAAAQPFHYLDRYTIIHNGEIYNYIELRTELIAKGYSFRTQTDTEVLVAAYDCWKKDCLEKFDGMFAFAIWDEQEKEFFAARDRFGEKPFYYIYNKEQKYFLFASEIKAFWAIGMGKELNQKMLFNFLTIGYTDNPEYTQETFYNRVDKLAASHFISLRTTDFTLETDEYWDLDPEYQDKSISDEQAFEKFNELFSVSVKRRLRSDVPLGTSLSGGLDSSSIIALMKEQAAWPDQLHSFSAVFPGFEKNEEQYIDKTAKHFSLQSHKTFVSDNELADLFKKLIHAQDEPFGSAGTLAQYKVFELAKEHNVKVLLDGQGADEILAGYSKYYKWYWQELFRKRKLIVSSEVKKAKELGVAERFGFRNIIAALLPDFASVFLEREYLLKALKQEDLTKDFVSMQSKEAYYSRPTMYTLNGILYFNTRTHGLEELLRYADRNSMAHGREVRLPYLSHELVEFIFSLPSTFKIRQGWTKWILRKIMDKKLPDEITWRKDKVGFEPPQLLWMQQSSVQEMIHEARRKLVNEKILKPEVLDKKIQPAPAYEQNNYDWRYLVSAQYIK